MSPCSLTTTVYSEPELKCESFPTTYVVWICESILATRASSYQDTMGDQVAGQATQNSREIFQNNPGALAPRDGPNAEGTAGRSSIQEALAHHLLQNLATQGSQGQNISTNFNTFHNTNNVNVTSYNAPGSYMPVSSGDSNTHSHNLAPAESPSQVDLTTGFSRDHDNQEAPITTSANSHPGTDLISEVPDSHEDNPEVPIGAPQPYYAMIPEDPYSVNRWAEPTQREHKYLCVTCQQRFSSKREKDEHIRSYHTCRWCRVEFVSYADLTKHLEKARAMCLLCPQEFFCRVEDYQTHVVEQMHVRCELCKTYFVSEACIEAHKRLADIHVLSYKLWTGDRFSYVVYPRCSWCHASEPHQYEFPLCEHIQQKHPACTWCDAEAFRSQLELDTHFEEQHRRCDMDGCETRCTSWKDLKKHKNDAHPRCDLCPNSKRRFLSRQARDARRAEHPACNLCSKNVRDLQILKQHKRLDHPICEFYKNKGPFLSVHEFHKHQRKQHYVCESHNRVFKHRDELNDHRWQDHLPNHVY